MMKILAGLAIVAIALVAGVLYVIPISTPRAICAAAERWDQADGTGRLNHPMGLAWDGRFLYVADTENGVVKKFRPDGSLAAAWTGFERPVAIAATPHAVYVADFLADRITKLRPDGSIVLMWGRHGRGPGEFDAPSGVAADVKGRIYVTDFYNHRVEAFTSDGTFVREWGRDGRWDGEFHYPTDVAVGLAGKVYVADAYNHRIEAFSAEGAYLRKWGGLGYGMPGKWGGWFRLAKAVTVDPAGNVYVADAFNRRIQKFSADGRLVGAWGNGPSSDQQVLQYPAGVAAGDDGVVYVSDFFKNRIWKLDCR